MKKTIKLICIIVFALAIISICSKVEAASASISASKTNVTVGDSVTVTVKYTAAAWNLTVSGDGVSSTPYVGNTEDAKNATTTKTITLNTSSAGTKTIYLKGDVSDGDTDVTTKINTSVKVTVNPKTTSSGTTGGNASSGSSTTTQKATLTKLVVAGKTYKNPAKSITVKVDNDVTTAKITPTTSNGESYKIDKGSNVKLEEGTNTVKITLASGNVYTVYIRRAAKEVDTPNVIEEKPAEEVKVLLKSLVIKGVKTEEEKVDLSYTPEFSSSVYEYSVNVESDITKLDIQAVANLEDANIEITGNEELKEGENIVTILVKSKDGKSTATYQIKVIKEPKTVEATAEVMQEIPQETNETNSIIAILVSVFTALVAIAGIVFAVIEYNYSQKHPKEKMGKIPYSDIGFKDEENGKEDILEEVKEDKASNENDVQGDVKRRGKHF